MVASAGNPSKIPKHKQPSLIKSLAGPKPTLIDDKILFSFKNLDTSQGQKIEEWEEDKILSRAVDRIRHISDKTVTEAEKDKLLRIYGGFPKPSEFKHPKHISNEANWARISIQGKERIIGELIVNLNLVVFSVIFLDKDHGFWPTKLKRT